MLEPKNFLQVKLLLSCVLQNPGPQGPCTAAHLHTQVFHACSPWAQARASRLALVGGIDVSIEGVNKVDHIICVEHFRAAAHSSRPCFIPNDHIIAFCLHVLIFLYLFLSLSIHQQASPLISIPLHPSKSLQHHHYSTTNLSTIDQDACNNTIKERWRSRRLQKLASTPSRAPRANPDHLPG